MSFAARISPLALAALAMGCDMAPTAPEGEVSRAAPMPAGLSYGGIETRLLDEDADGDLVQFLVRLGGPGAERVHVERYAECAAAQYALIRGYGFARPVRTSVEESGRVWAGDAVYTISAALPRGIKTIDAEVVANDCAENGIPMV